MNAGGLVSAREWSAPSPWPPLAKAPAYRARVLERRTQRLLLELARRIPGAGGGR